MIYYLHVIVIKKKLCNGLIELSSNSTIIEIIEAVETLLVYCNNLILFPNDDKYRKIKVSNIHYQERLGHLKGSIICMDSIGYTIQDEYLRLQYNNDDNKKVKKTTR